MQGQLQLLQPMLHRVALTTLLSNLRLAPLPRALPACRAAAIMGKKNYYAVARGREPGIYRTWPECEAQVLHVKSARFKGFASEQEAHAYLRSHGQLAVAGDAPQLPPKQRQQQQRQQPEVAGPSAVAEAGRGGAAPSAGQPCTSGRVSDAQKAAYAGARLRMVSLLPMPTPQPRASRAPHLWQAPASLLQPRQTCSQPRNRSASAPFPQEFDGASKRNPGPSGFGAVLFDSASGEEVGRAGAEASLPAAAAQTPARVPGPAAARRVEG